jgi:hypothetical protein
MPSNGVQTLQRCCLRLTNQQTKVFLIIHIMLQMSATACQYCLCRAHVLVHEMHQSISWVKYVWPSQISTAVTYRLRRKEVIDYFEEYNRQIDILYCEIFCTLAVSANLINFLDYHDLVCGVLYLSNCKMGHVSLRLCPVALIEDGPCMGAIGALKQRSFQGPIEAATPVVALSEITQQAGYTLGQVTGYHIHHSSHMMIFS